MGVNPIPLYDKNGTRGDGSIMGLTIDTIHPYFCQINIKVEQALAMDKQQKYSM